MLQAIKKYILHKNQYFGVEHSVTYEQEVIHSTCLKKLKNTLDVNQRFSVYSIENLASKLPSKTGIFLILNNNHVISKQVASNKSLEADNVIHNAFPNINLADFYYEYITQNSSTFISICRKDYLDTLIEKYQNHDIQIIGISLGNLIFSSATSFLEDQIFFTSNAKIVLENKSVQSIESNKANQITKHNINGIATDNTYILSLFGALIPAVHYISPVNNFNALKTSLKTAFEQTRYFKLLLKTGLLLLLTVLLINFFVFNRYFNKVSMLEQTSQVNLNSKQSLLKLNEETTKAQKMVDDMFKNSISKSSFFVNGIVKSLPNSIVLSELNYQPLAKNIKTNAPVAITENTIIVSGESLDSRMFSEWLNKLENLSWIAQVDILNYNDAAKSISNFSVKITIANED